MEFVVGCIMGLEESSEGSGILGFVLSTFEVRALLTSVGAGD